MTQIVFSFVSLLINLLNVSYKVWSQYVTHLHGIDFKWGKEQTIKTRYEDKRVAILELQLEQMYLQRCCKDQYSIIQRLS